MKNLLVIIFLVSAFISCKNEGNIQISGNLIGASADTIILTPKSNPLNRKESNVEILIPVSIDGRFSSEFKGKADYYSIRSKSKIMQNPLDLFLQPKQEFQINIQTENWLREREYTVINSWENEYLKTLNKNMNDFRRKYNPRKIDQIVFLAALDSFELDINESLNKLIDTEKKVRHRFMEIERNRILYTIGFLKEDYALRNRTSKLSDDYFDYRTNLDLNNHNLLDIVAKYGMYVRRYISNETRRTLPEDEDWSVHQINTCVKNITNQLVLDYVLINEVELSLGYSKKYDEAIELFLTNCSNERYKEMASSKYQIYLNTKPGRPSPKFSNYEKYEGGTMSLDDLKGKVLLIDIWATWCGPCIAEIPALKELEKKYRGKGIEFVSISIDEAKSKNAWKTMIEDEQLKGVQLFADNVFKSSFLKEYNITGIPRFILLDAEGNIINAMSPRPSSNELDLLIATLLN